MSFYFVSSSINNYSEISKLMYASHISVFISDMAIDTLFTLQPHPQHADSRGSKMSSKYTFNSCIRGYHVYKDISGAYQGGFLGVSKTPILCLSNFK